MIYSDDSSSTLLRIFRASEEVCRALEVAQEDKHNGNNTDGNCQGYQAGYTDVNSPADRSDELARQSRDLIVAFGYWRTKFNLSIRSSSSRVYRGKGSPLTEIALHHRERYPGKEKKENIYTTLRAIAIAHIHPSENNN